MDQHDVVRLPYGLNPLPPGVRIAWGARWIIRQDGYIDHVWDRQHAVGPDGPRRDLQEYLRYNAIDLPEREAQRLLSRGELSTREERTVTLWQDDKVIVEANPNASGGYLYVRAYYKADVQADQEA